MNTTSDKETESTKLVNFLGKKWTLVLLDILDFEPKNYNELNSITEKTINPTLLSERLKKFTQFNIIKKETINNRMKYTLTEEGHALKQLLEGINQWFDYNTIISKNVNSELTREYNNTLIYPRPKTTPPD